MPEPKKGPRLGGSPSHQKAILANLTSDLFRHGRVVTTEAKARMLRPFAERLVSLGKKGDLASLRRAARVVRDKEVLRKLFREIAPGFANRPGGYTRVLKIGPRKGDGAPLALVELVERERVEEKKEAAPRRRWRLRSRGEARPES